MPMILSKTSAASFFLFPFIAPHISLRASCALSPDGEVAAMMYLCMWYLSSTNFALACTFALSWSILPRPRSHRCVPALLHHKSLLYSHIPLSITAASPLSLHSRRQSILLQQVHVCLPLPVCLRRHTPVLAWRYVSGRFCISFFSRYCNATWSSSASM